MLTAVRTLQEEYEHSQDRKKDNFILLEFVKTMFV